MIFAIEKLKNRQEIIVVFSCILILILIKLPYLHLPFYWDEAWSYAVAVNEMYTHKITLLPSQVNQEIFRGHPLFFYFLTSLFAKISGFNPLSMHVWMLVLTCVSSLSFYFIIKNLYNSSIALLSLVFLLFQESFIVQSSFLLPEILIAFLSGISFYYYFKQSFWAYVLFGSLLVLTKESGIVAIIAICIHCFCVILYKQEFTLASLKRLFIYSLPLLVFFLFICLQKLKWGWFLFPEHTGMMDFSWASIKGKLVAFKDYVFFLENRSIYSVLFFISIPLLVVLRRTAFMQLLKDQRMLLYFLFILLYCSFSAVNFYTVRYLLSLMPLLAVLSAISFHTLFNSKAITFYFSIATGLFFALSYFYFPANFLGDISKHYVQSVSTQKDVFDHFISQHPQETFGADFLTGVNMQHPETGYLQKNNVVNVVPVEEATYIITTSIEPMEIQMKQWLADSSIHLVYENIDNPAWCRVYERSR